MSLIDRIESADRFDPAPGPLCAWCEYQEACPEWRSERPVAAPAFPNPSSSSDGAARCKFPALAFWNVTSLLTEF